MVKGRVWRHQRGSQNPYIEDEQTTQWSKDDFEDTKGVFHLFFWPLCCLFLFDIMILAAPLVSSNSSFDHCVVYSSSVYGFWLPLWCLQTRPLTIVLSVRLRYKDSDYPFGVFKLFFWPLCWLFVFDIKILTTPLVSSNSSFDHCVVCSSSINGLLDNTMVKRRVWRHQRGSHNPYIEDEQTTQWSKEEFEDTKGVVRIFISKTNSQHNGQKKSLKTPKGETEAL
jgi:predicted GIY-YIG superfamily endonuclease